MVSKDQLTEDARAEFASDDPLHYLHVLPEDRETEDPEPSDLIEDDDLEEYQAIREAILRDPDQVPSGKRIGPQ